MDRDELLRQLMGTFLDELDEHVETINQVVLAVEAGSRSGGRDTATVIFRSVHSLKGAARAVDISVVETACHRLEELLSPLREGEAELDTAICAVLFAAADAFADVSQRMRRGISLADAPVQELLLQLDAALMQDRAGEATTRAPGHERMTDVPRADGPGTVSESELMAALEDIAALGAPVAFARPQESADSPGQSESISSSAAETRDRRESLFEPTVRVSAAKLDALLTRTGELLVSVRRAEVLRQELMSLLELVSEWQHSLLMAPRDGRAGTADVPMAALQSSLHTLSARLEALNAAALHDFRSIEQAASEVNDEVHLLRLLPFGSACRGLDRVVRDLAAASNKRAVLSLDGANVEIDRSVLEGLRSPLLHLLRNAVEHGIEPAPERIRAGKSDVAHIVIAASLRGAQVEVMVGDDGRGLDFEQIRKQALERGLPVSDQPHELIQHIFSTGFSTAPVITRVSGRGVGLDIVKHQVETLHGSIRVFTEPDVGTRFVITMPLTLTTIHVLLVRIGNQRVALPITGVVDLVRMGSSDVIPATGQQTFLFQGTPVPVVSLAALMGLGRQQIPTTGKIPAAVIAGEGSMAALVVDELLSEQEIVVKNLGPRIRHVRYVAGCTILQDGEVALVLNVAELVAAAMNRDVEFTLTRPVARRTRRILVADDSVTSRTLEKTILENAGYEVLTASDGMAAWEALQRDGEVDAVIADVEMPRMDGFALTEAVRASATLRQLPVILLTSLDREHDRERGVEMGANAYLVKSVFDQSELLEVIRRIL
ncbi:MAG: hybrid sensor histidine kinase/response regulator [Proteobacteria bacterium]|nr:hybrid sensor histidine kinase/response regulator [Pseudomonadota bacterium]